MSALEGYGSEVLAPCRHRCERKEKDLHEVTKDHGIYSRFCLTHQDRENTAARLACAGSREER